MFNLIGKKIMTILLSNILLNKIYGVCVCDKYFFIRAASKVVEISCPCSICSHSFVYHDNKIRWRNIISFLWSTF